MKKPAPILSHSMPTVCPTCKKAIPGGAASCPACGKASDRHATSTADGATVLLPESYEKEVPRPASQPTAQGTRSGKAGSLGGPYEIVREIARGAMGIVYKAKDPKLDRFVALKVLLAGDLAGPDQVARFQREAQAAAKLNHPHIVPIYDVGVAGGKHFFTMEFVEGKSLHELFQSRNRPIEESVRWLAQVADAMEHAHKHGIIHRDLKPANILVDAEGSVRVTDFGLSKAVHGSQLTESGTTLGTPSYMPPEQARGAIKEIDAQSDVYAMGAVLYEALTGVPPFVGETNVDTILRVVKEDPVPPRRLEPSVPAELEAVSLKALEKEKSRRYASAKEVGDDLRRWLAKEPVLARPASLGYRIRRRVERNAKWFAIGAAVLLANVILLIAISHRKKGPEPPQPPAADDRWERKIDEAFRDPKLPLWECEGAWKAEGGALVGDGDATLRLREPIDGSVAVELDLVAPTERPGTIEVRLGGGKDPFPSAEAAPGNGKVRLVLGEPTRGWRPRDWQGQLAGATFDAEAPGGSAHVLRVERTALSLDAFWDRSAAPVAHLELAAGADAIRPEVRLSRGTARVTGVRVFGESATFRGSPLPAAERLRSRGLFSLAQESYDDFLSTHKTGPLAAEAQYLSAECVLRAADASENLAGYREAKGLLAAVADPRWTARAAEGIRACDEMLAAGEAAGGIGTLPGLSPSDPFNRFLGALFMLGRESLTPDKEAAFKKAHDDAVAGKKRGKLELKACTDWASCAILNRKWKEAEAIYQDALAAAPQGEEAKVWFMIILCRFEQEDFDGVQEADASMTAAVPRKAMDRFREFFQTNRPPGVDDKKWARDAFDKFKKEALKLGDQGKAAEEMKGMAEAMALRPYFQYARTLCLKALAYQGKMDEAMRGIEQAEKRDAGDPLAEGRLLLVEGELARLAGDAKKARGAFDELAKRSDWMGFEAVAQLLETGILEGKFDEVLSHERELKARFKEASQQQRLALWYGLASACANQGAKAEAAWREGLAVPKGEPAVQVALKLALAEDLNEGELKRAQLSLPETKLWRGVGAWMKGDKTKAKEYLAAAANDAVGGEHPAEIAKFLAKRP